MKVIISKNILKNAVNRWSRRKFSQKSEAVPAQDLGNDGDNQMVMSEPCKVGPCYSQPRVVIIGAGMAGISAAHRLTQCGINNFTVLEATEKPGGRIHSCWLGDVVAELGAHWKPDRMCRYNPVYDLSVHDGMAALPRSDPTRGLFCSAVGGPIMDLPLSITAYHKFREIEKEAAQLFCLGGSKQHGSLLNFFGMRIQQELANYSTEQKYDAARIMFGMMNVLRNKCGDDLTLVSADNVGSYVELPGGEVRVPLGLIGILSPLLRNIPDCTIKYSKPVNIVHWGTAQKSGFRAVVQCSDGEEFPADYVIVTVSNGVLKALGNKMFCPTLPGNKMDAVRSLGYGMCNKVFLEYCRPFWFWSTMDLNFSFTPEDLQDRCDWTRGVIAIEQVPESKHVLCAWVTGQEAVEMEKLPDPDIAEGLTRIIRCFTGNTCIPYPSSVIRSRWCSSPYFCGAYSFTCCPEEVAQEHQFELASPLPGPSDPVPPVLLFAGEATVPGHYATVLGARLSGVREAERVVQLTNRFRGPPVPAEEPVKTPLQAQMEMAGVRRDCSA